MMKERKESFTKGLLSAMKEGAVSVPYLLLKYYRHLNLSDMEAMLLVQIIAFKEKEQKDFPTIEELQLRMSAEPAAVIHTLQKLMKQQFLTIDEAIDPHTGIHYEQYNLQQTFEKLAHCYAEDLEVETQAAISNAVTTDTAISNSEQQAASAMPNAGALPTESEQGRNIFTVFETEFARPLSPMEYETISAWIDHDRYNEELILAALREAVFAGKLHFKYIDRILIDWARHRIQTAEQAKQYTLNFRNR